jgi:formylglycine-generating enzyme required for sulfatase activity
VRCGLQLGTSVLVAALLVFQSVSATPQNGPEILPVEQQAESDAFNQASVAISEFQKGDQNKLWHALKRGGDPAVRTVVIHQLAARGVSAAAVLNRLRRSKDAGERAALVLSLGEFAPQQIPSVRQRSVVALLLKLYRSDPDPEVHSAVDWLFRYSNEGPNRPQFNWAREADIKRIDQQLSRRPQGVRVWSLNSSGQTMIVIRALAPFRTGAPATEARSREDETPHVVRIPRDYAIASKEVSVAQFQQYLAEEGGGLQKQWMEAVRQRFPLNPASFWSDADRPQFAVTWYEAAGFCNWLSKKSGISPDQWIYPDNIGPGMTLPPDYLHRTGYRLPTESEWEFAARAGTLTAHFFGNGVAWLDRYAWFTANSDNHGWPVGMLKPNQLGLFDVYGNAWEWLQDRRRDYPIAEGGTSVDVEDSSLIVTNEIARTRRGGSWSYDKETTRSAHRGADTYFPDQRRDSVGFRVARTISTRATQ